MLKNKIISMAAVVLLSSSQSFSGGWEKVVFWSGEANGRAGAAVSSVTDSSALFLNPGALSENHVGVNVSGLFSTFTFNGVDSLSGFSTPGAIHGSFRLNDQLTLGVGAAVIGGTNTDYDGKVGVTLGLVDSSVSRFVQAGLGLAYRCSANWSVGLGWYATMASWEAGIDLSGSGIADYKYDGTSFVGFRVGAHYAADNFGFGINVRTPVANDAKADGTALMTSAGAINEIAMDLPTVVSAGMHGTHSKTTYHSQITWKNYGANDGITGLTAPWSDEFIVRLGTDYQLNEMMDLRFGYAVSSQVTSDASLATDVTRAVASTPGVAQGVTLGAGLNFGKLELDLAADYSWVANKTPEHESKSFGIHTGLGLNF